ncbi:homocysteine S-methyltransferase [Phanerochaete sordida]|uniref:Homocysteine S-methyltransferase n=1 Tax=Phanerochaete sordida TaxID=48140 RepID=A0A9P3GGS3_9APHY|nr:homocysteine S-methyltransferase [Phanerochaete sordida]
MAEDTATQERRLPRVLILDGGLGTTLEDVFHRDISTPLWSARPIEQDPEVIIEAHLAFLRAGARIISTATYQSAFTTFEKSGYTRPDAVCIMRKAVTLAQTAKTRFLAERSDVRPGDVHIALALGPYGATLHANEFDGLYPPPFGPGGSHNHFAPGEDALCAQSIQALESFHLDRLRVFAGDAQTWDALDWVAFETLPLAREVTAVRRAMRVLLGELAARPDACGRKRWWISTVHPSGVFPGRASDGGVMTAGAVARAVLGRADPALAVPDGVGVNCTGVRHLPGLLAEVAAAVAEECGDAKPWLVLYPNGREWDVTAQSWVALGAGEEDAAEAWATALAEAAAPYAGQHDIWQGLILGGCCKSGPKEISALAQLTCTSHA